MTNASTDNVLHATIAAYNEFYYDWLFGTAVTQMLLRYGGWASKWDHKTRWEKTRYDRFRFGTGIWTKQPIVKTRRKWRRFKTRAPQWRLRWMNLEDGWHKPEDCDY